MRGLTLTTQDQARLQVLNGVLAKLWPAAQAAEILGITERHVWRLLAAYREEGAAALAHGNRGHRPANATPAVVRDEVIALARERYSGINHTHLSELLAEREGLALSRSTVRRLLVGAGLPSPRRRRPPGHRMRRQRMPQEGMLLQLDGSHHAWLGERGPRLCLLLAIDDATGTAPYALFQEQETTDGYLRLLRGVAQTHGIPLAIYTDRHAAFGPPRRTSPETPAAARKLTQVARALRELGVTQIFALSPEAKGRVERANETFQDRLVTELRLAGACTLAEANCVLADFLPRFDRRFGVPPVETGTAYRIPAPDFDLDSVFCLKERRQVAKDNTVPYHGRVLQLFPDADRPSYAGTRVEVRERLDGQVLVFSRGKLLTPGEAPPLAVTLRARAAALATAPRATADELYPLVPVRPPRPRAPVVPGPLAGETIWYEDPVRKGIHTDLVRAGMERARQQGKRIGRPRVSDREGFLDQFTAVLEGIAAGNLSRRRAAKELDIGYATLKRLIDARLAALRREVANPLQADGEHPRTDLARETVGVGELH